MREKLNKCIALMCEVSENKQKDVKNQNIARQNNTFFDAYNEYFVPTIKSYILCKKYDHISFSNNIHDEIKEYVKYSKNIFEKREVNNPIKYRDGIKKLSEKIKNEWTNQTEQFLANIKEELGILKLISNDKKEIQKILISMNNFSKWPLNETIIEEYDLEIRKANEILSRMKFDDDKIVTFLKKVKNKEATLLDLSDTIIEWIQKEDLLGNIMLSIKN